MKVLSEVRRKARVQTVNDLPSKTDKSQANRAEIKHVLAKYKQVGIIDHLRSVDLQFRDVTEFTDYADLARQSKEAEHVFMSLPSKVREVFDHDMMKWLDAAHDPDKLEALRPRLEKLGVLEPKPAQLSKSADGRLKDRRRLAELTPDPSLVERRRTRQGGAKSSPKAGPSSSK